MDRLVSTAMAGWIAAAAVLVMVPIATLSPVSAAAFDDCATEAASQYEPGFEEIGQDTWQIDTDAAIAACKKALEDDRESAQLKAWLARAYWSAGDSAKAAPLLEDAAAAENLLAITMLGDMLIAGDGVDADAERGVGLLQIAADGGYALALNSLGLSYDYGDGVEQDKPQAARYYRMAAEHVGDDTTSD